MTKFLDKKEQVFDLKLTPYGHHLLSTGEFKPEYYSFYDDNILYDGGYAGQSEMQNEIKNRIKNETPYIEGLVRFTDTETTVGEDSSRLRPSRDLFRLDTSIGDAYLNGEPQKAASWKVVALQSLITSSAAFDEENDSLIPQLNIDSVYTKKITNATYNFDPTSIRRFQVESAEFADGKTLTLVTDEPVIYIEEQNTEILSENFDIEVFEILQGINRSATATITIDDYSNFDYDESITLVAADGKAVKIESGIANSTTAADGAFNTTTFLAENSNAITAVNLTHVINLFSDWFAATPTTEDSDDTIGIITITQVTPGANGNTSIALVDPGDGSWSATNFKSGLTTTQLKRKYFMNEDSQIENGLLVKDTPAGSYENSDETTQNDVDYYFKILVDQEIDKTTACAGALEFNKQSYYVDLDFDCNEMQVEDNQYNDIYGSEVGEPEVCQ